MLNNNNNNNNEQKTERDFISVSICKLNTLFFSYMNNYIDAVISQ